MTEREEILKLLADNAHTIEDNLAEFVIRNGEDLIEAGVCPAKVTDTMMTCAVSFLVKRDGGAAAAGELRRLAGVVEAVERRLAGAQPAQRH